ncbi:MAG: protein translocase SEC61 complex subunit gamma [Candidatus Diapherotrites archaeon]|nr:protein translocase SEC61 complex subunit gamma [Candidatus Diapherotrites archaeon]
MSFIDEYIRVIKLTRKPKKDEFLMIAKVTGVGLVLIGLLGTAISLLGSLLKGF